VQKPIIPGRTILLRIRVHGPKGARDLDAVLDTGAALVSVPPEDAINLGYSLQDAPVMRVSTANGTIDAPQIILSRVDMGELQARDVPAVCLNIAGGAVSSLLGMSMLGRYRIVIDPAAKMLTITEP
jgi:aspartyl protease family protein